MFQKIIGIAGAVLVLGTIVMVAVSPGTEGFFPGMFDFLKHRPAVEAARVLPPADTLRVDAPSVPLPDSTTSE